MIYIYCFNLIMSSDFKVYYVKNSFFKIVDNYSYIKMGADYLSRNQSRKLKYLFIFIIM